MDEIDKLNQRLENIKNARDNSIKKEEEESKKTEEVEEPKDDSDARSIFVTAVDFSATEQDIQKFFDCCGKILRVTKLCDRYTRRPNGHVYIEFDDPACVAHALKLNEHLFKGRQIKVLPKRKNIHNFPGRRRSRRSYH